MGYGASSKGGGGSGSADGGKKKLKGKNNKPISRKKKKATTAIANYAPPPSPAFTVQAPNPEHRARLLAGRWQEEQIAAARRKQCCKPVNGTTPSGRVLGSSTSESAVVVTTDDMIEQQQQKQPPTNREARSAFLATQEAKMQVACREQTAKRRATTEQQSLLFAHQISLAKQHWNTLAARLLDDSTNAQVELEKIHRLLVVVLRNAATKSDPKYKRLNASKNDNLWTRLLRFQEVVAILEEGAGFQRKEVVIEQIEMEHLKLAQKALDSDEAASLMPSGSRSNNDSNPAIASLVADLDTLGIAAGKLVAAAARDDDDDDKEARDFELYHVGVGADGLGLKRILALLRAVETWQL